MNVNIFVYRLNIKYVMYIVSNTSTNKEADKSDNKTKEKEPENKTDIVPKSLVYLY